MMVLVPRIATVSQLATTPFIYGIQHEGNLRAELLLSDFPEVIRRFTAHEADIALVPATAVPALSDARLLQDYCIGATGATGTPLLVSNDSPEAIRRLYLDPAEPTSAQLAVWFFETLNLRPEYIALTDREQLAQAQAGDAFLLTGDNLAPINGSFSQVWDLSAHWSESTQEPFTYAVWVAHEGVDADVIEQFQYALTFGLEHSYEAILDSPYAAIAGEAYLRLTAFDFIFDNQKNKALHKFWDLGLKVAPRTNPG